jgi:hypothetical protein
VIDREVVPRCAQVRTKCTEKTSVGLWGQSRDPRELPGVTGLSHGVVGVLHSSSSITHYRGIKCSRAGGSLFTPMAEP